MRSRLATGIERLSPTMSPSPGCAGRRDPGAGALVVDVNGVEVGIFRVQDRLVAWRNVCPRMSAPVCRGTVTGTTLRSAVYEYEHAETARSCSAPGTAGSST